MRKSAVIFVISGCLLVTAALAQSTSAPAAARGQHARGRDRVFQQLNLSADQQSQLKQIRQEQRSQMQALRANTSLSPEQRQEQIKALRESNHQKVMALLTPDQQAQFKQLQQQRRGRMRQGGRRFDALQSLNLTQQQKDQLKPIFQSTRQQMQALRSDSSLTPDQRREKMKEIRQNQQAQLKSILTPEQQQQLQQMRRHPRGGQQAAPAPQGF